MSPIIFAITAGTFVSGRCSSPKKASGSSGAGSENNVDGGGSSTGSGRLYRSIDVGISKSS